MSRLVLLRHGQASFLAEDYDKLSPLGRQQVSWLGEYWLGQGVTFDRVLCGPRRRHFETVAELQDCYRQAGVPWPEVQPLVEFDEHQVDLLVIEHAAALAERHRRLGPLREAFDRARTSSEKHRCFQRLFEVMAEIWQQGETTDVESHDVESHDVESHDVESHDVESQDGESQDGESHGVESWTAFQARVNRGLDEVLQQAGSGETVLVSTSVGPITIAVQRALRCADDVALQTGWRLWNSSLTEFVFSGNRFTLDVFNALPHLARTTWTYR